MNNSLKINTTPESDPAEQSSNLLRRTENNLITPCNSGRFSFMKTYSAKKVPGGKYSRWKPPTIIKTATRWYVSYYYMSPENKWVRFRVFEDINRIKTDEYSELLKDAVEYSLKNGYDPFADERHTAFTPSAKTWTIQQALYFFMQHQQEKGIDPRSVAKYQESVNVLIDWLKARNLQNVEAKLITKHHLESCLRYAMKDRKWSNRHFNNVKSFLSTAFIYLQDQKIITDNPCKGIGKKKTLAKKHKAYDKETLPKVLKEMKDNDPTLYLAACITYYLCIRSDKELKNLKVKHIDTERMQVWVKAETAKTDRDRLVPLCQEMLDIFNEYRILKANRECFVVTITGEPGPTPFGRGFLSKRFGKLRKRIGLDSRATLYSFKHTRVIHLKLDGAKDEEIMALTGHTTYSSYSDYLRDLGMDVDPAAINKYSRKL